jgi:hypothetical protein
MADVTKWEDRLPLCPGDAEIIGAMEGEIAELRAALQAQQGDALDVERYRFLRARTVAWNALRPPEWKTGEKLDTAIDAAMLAARREG